MRRAQRFLIRDRGSDFTASFDAVVQAAGTRILVSARTTMRPGHTNAQRSPNATAPFLVAGKCANGVFHPSMSMRMRAPRAGNPMVEASLHGGELVSRCPYY